MRRRLALVLAGVLALGACGSGGDGAQPVGRARHESVPLGGWFDPTPPTTTTSTTAAAVVHGLGGGAAAARLERAGSCDDAVAWLRESGLERVNEYGLPLRTWAVGAPMAMPMPAAPGSSSDTVVEAGSSASGGGFSTTNVQEAGVGEPDLVVNDGDRAFVVIGKQLQEIRLHDGKPTVTATELPLSQGGELLLDGDHLVVIGYDYSSDGGPHVVVVPVDVATPGAPRAGPPITFEGQQVAARLLNGEVHLVTTSTPQLTFTGPADDSPGARAAATAQNRKVVREATFADWLPNVACSRVYRPQTFSGFSTTTVYTFATDDPGHSWQESITADAAVVYASTSSLVIATQDFSFQMQPAMGGAPPADAVTDIHMLDLTDRGASYRASARVTGYLQKQWALSERDGILRVATTSRPLWLEDTEHPASSSVITLRPEGDHLVELGRIDGIGRNEIITGVRFVGDVAFVVTFRRVDPLHVIDLSDPTKPRLRGVLRTPGFAEYLHPIGDDLMIGVGRNPDSASASVTVVDVGDLDRPAETARLELANSYLSAEYDHHAFLYWPARDLLVVPGYGDGVEGAFVLRATKDAVTEVGHIAHAEHRREGVYANFAVARALVANDVLYTVSGMGVMANDLESLEELGWAEFSTS
jgi:uncharacterized secreted protein with C-terminal beta-propeller domain